MLTKGLRNEEQEKLNQILHIALQLGFVTELWDLEAKKQMDQILRQTTQLSLPDIATWKEEDLIEQLKALNFNFSNIEQLADLLLKTSEVEPGFKMELSQKSLALYQYVQRNSQTFSFGILQKIENLEKQSEK